MSFTAFPVVFPELSQAETRTVTTVEGSYTFVELYCDDPGCDCRRVRFHVLEEDGSRAATLNYGWERLDFYERWVQHSNIDARLLKGPNLQPHAPQGPDPEAALDALRVVLSDPAYVARLERHDRMFREAVEQGRVPRQAAGASLPGPKRLNRAERRALRKGRR